MSEVGSVDLEFNYLSHVTGNNTYADKAKKVRTVLSEIDKPGELYPNYLNPKTGRFCQSKISFYLITRSLL